MWHYRAFGFWLLIVIYQTEYKFDSVLHFHSK